MNRKPIVTAARHEWRLLQAAWMPIALAARDGGVTTALGGVFALQKLLRVKSAWMPIALAARDGGVTIALGGVFALQKLLRLKSAWMLILISLLTPLPLFSQSQDFQIEGTVLVQYRSANGDRQLL